MLCITRRVNQWVRIGEADVLIRAIEDGTVHLGINAPPEVRILRDNAKRKEPPEHRKKHDRR